MCGLRARAVLGLSVEAPNNSHSKAVMPRGVFVGRRVKFKEVFVKQDVTRTKALWYAIAERAVYHVFWIHDALLWSTLRKRMQCFLQTCNMI